MSKMICKCKEESFSGLENKYFDSYVDAVHYIDDEIDFEKEYPNSMATIKEIHYGPHKGKYQIFDYPRNQPNPFEIKTKSYSGNEEQIRWGTVVFNESVGDITIKVQKQIDWDDWVVRWYVDGKYDENKSSFNLDSKTDAIKEARSIIEHIKNKDKGFSGRIVNEDLARTSPCHKVESTRYFKKGIAGSLNKEQVKDYCFEKE